MSRASFEKGFVNPLLRKLDTEARKSVERQRGQLLILADTKDLEAVIKLVIPEISVEDRELYKALEAAKSKAIKLQKIFISKNKTRYNAIVAKLPEIRLPHTLGKDMFIVSSFTYSINVIKKAMLESLVNAGVFNEEQSAEISKNLHKGHGSRGTAVSQVQIARAVSDIDVATKNLLLHNLKASMSAGELSGTYYNEIESLVSNSSQIVTKKGALKANYVSVISFQVGKENIADATEEKALKAAFRAFVKDLTPSILNMEGSSSLKQKVERLVVEQFTGKKNLKVTSKALSHSLSTKNKVSTSPKKKPTNVKIKKGTPKKGKRRTTNSKFSLAPILGILNSELPKVVAKNMDDPRLNYRTGRFAASVKVTDVTQTAKGFPSIGYTYMKYPYQTFETGFAKGSVDRDPRKLIDVSIREIAAGLAIGRFYTRRV